MLFERIEAGSPS